jgi:HK97 family phage prohead protease/HK97 family phage major capsid protein
MDVKNKVIYFNSRFTTKAADEESDGITIEGYASTNDVDRVGDVVPTSVWEKGLKNYLKNPIILAYHNHQMPVGKMVEHRVDERGLWIKATISDAADNVYKLVKKGILSAFSIGFRVKDAEYNNAAEVFLIKDLELHEISVVSIPANQNTLFSLSKAFDSAEEFELFKQQFAVSDQSAKGLDNHAVANSANERKWNMDPKELELMLAKATASAAEQAAKAVVEAQAKALAEKAAQEKAEAELQAKIKAAVASVQTVDTGAERLLADVEKRLSEQAEAHKSALEGLEATLREKAAELEAVQKSRMQFTDKRDGEGATYAEKEAAVFISKITNKPIEETKYAKSLVQKYASAGTAGAAGSGGGAGGAIRLPGQTWETEVSTNMENEIRRQLVVAGTIRQIAMTQPFMKLPINPDAGADATWVTNAQFGGSNSSGSPVTHALKDIEISSAKLATKEYIAFEEEEDGLIALVPLIRDAITRRMAKTLDKSMLLGNDVGATTYAAGINGLAYYDDSASSSPTVAVGGKLTFQKFLDARRALGVWGLEPSELIMFVSQAAYYDLLEDNTFQSTDKISESRNTLITGQIGLLTQTPVVVTAQMTGVAANDALAVLVNPRNFVVGNHRAMRIDTDDEVINQRRVIVASMRVAMSRLTSNEGSGVVTIRYV